MAIWYAKQSVKTGGAGFMIAAGGSAEEAFALLDQLAEAVDDDQIDFNLFTTTAEKLYEMKQLDAAFTLSQNLTSGIMLANSYNPTLVEQTRLFLQRNYALQSRIYIEQNGSPEENFAEVALQTLNESGSTSAS